MPVTNVSLVDLTVTLSTPVPSKEHLLAPFRTAATTPPLLLPSAQSAPALQGVLAVSDEKLVSSDYLGTTASSTVDVDASVMLNETTAKIVAWYDNETGFASRSEYSRYICSESRGGADLSVRFGRVHAQRLASRTSKASLIERYCTAVSYVLHWRLIIKCFRLRSSFRPFLAQRLTPV